ncbi:hypothetical protein CWI39_1040p0010 [Hamiltosporidium magnivora]|uniref:Uncharacterized protein n=3 Tax=Hamiltosporidium TaxID=1176354 RepID=A0A4Q9L6A2_9MICR|nr:hypothetical protein CWI39_1040p0010 [Hamiltosporidium magnivora]
MQEHLPQKIEEQVVSISLEAAKNELSAVEKAKGLQNIYGDKIFPVFYKYFSISFLNHLSLPTNKYKESITSYNTRSNYVQRRKIDIQNDLNNHGIHYAAIKRKKENTVIKINNNVRDEDDKEKKTDITTSKNNIDSKNTNNDIKTYGNEHSSYSKCSKSRKKEIERILKSKKRKCLEEKSIKSDELTKLMISLEATVVEKPNFLSNEKLFELISSQLKTKYEISRKKYKQENEDPKRIKIVEQSKVDSINEDLEKNLKINFPDLLCENIFSFKIPNLSLLLLEFSNDINETFKVLINIDFEFSKKIIKTYSLDDECLYKFFLQFKDTDNLEEYVDLIDKNFLLKYNGTLRFPMKLIHRVFTMNGKNISENFMVEIWDLIKNLKIGERFKLYNSLRIIDNDASVNTRKFLKRLCMDNIEFISKKLIDLCASSPFSVIDEIFKSFITFNSLIPLYIELIKCMKEYFIDFFHFYILELLNNSDYENFECYDASEEMDLFSLERKNIYQDIDNDSSLNIADIKKCGAENGQNENIKTLNQSNTSIHKSKKVVENNEFKKIYTNGEYYQWFTNLCFFLRSFSDLIDRKLFLEYSSTMLAQKKYLFLPLAEALLFSYNINENKGDTKYKPNCGSKTENYIVSNSENNNEYIENKLGICVSSGITDIFKVKKLSLKCKTDMCSRYIMIWNKITGGDFFEERIKDILMKKIEFQTIKYLIPYEIEMITKFLSEIQIKEILSGIKECDSKKYHEIRNQIIFIDNIETKYLIGHDWVLNFIKKYEKSTREDLRVLANSCYAKLLVKEKRFKAEIEANESVITPKGNTSYISDSDSVPAKNLRKNSSSSEEGELRKWDEEENKLARKPENIIARPDTRKFERDSKPYEHSIGDRYKYRYQSEQSTYRSGFGDSKSVYSRNSYSYKRRYDDDCYRYKNTRGDDFYGKNRSGDRNISDDSSEYSYKKRR